MTHPNILLTLEEDRLRYMTVQCAVCRASKSIPRVSTLPREPVEIVRGFAEKHRDCKVLPRRPEHVGVDYFLAMQR